MFRQENDSASVIDIDAIDNSVAVVQWWWGRTSSLNAAAVSLQAFRKALKWEAPKTSISAASFALIHDTGGKPRVVL